MYKGRVLVGMSGGVDSSASCIILQENGYEVVGVTLRMWDREDCDGEPKFIDEARALAKKLGIEHHTVDIRGEFKGGVIEPFINEYMCGRTPNPCVMCNPNFKWHYLLATANSLNCDFVATGHYVNIINEDGFYWIDEGADKGKDQSYFLWGLKQEQLKRTIFPLGAMCKTDIKGRMAELGFKKSAEKSESMEICFIKDDYRTFLRQQNPNIDNEVNGGLFVDMQGRRLGQHKGYPFYTIGQRKGLEIALGKPAYVVKINHCKNTVKLGNEEDLLCSAMTIEKLQIPIPSLLTQQGVFVRVRYRGKPIAIKDIIFNNEDNTAKVIFADDAKGIAPGQSAVFYIGTRVVGGGIIASSTPKQQ